MTGSIHDQIIDLVKPYVPIDDLRQLMILLMDLEHAAKRDVIAYARKQDPEALEKDEHAEIMNEIYENDWSESE